MAKKKNNVPVSEEAIVGEIKTSSTEMDVEKEIDVYKAGLPDSIFEEVEEVVVSDPYMAVQGKPVAPSKVYVASREGNEFDIIVPVAFSEALYVFLSDYGSVGVGEFGNHNRLVAHILSIFPADQVFESVLSMLERMEKIHLSEKESR